MPPQLVSLNGGPSILLDKPIILIGRHAECDIQIDSRKISRRHCCIAQVNDYLIIRDLGSTNGIRINGVRVLEGRLKASDELTIGGSRFRVTWDIMPESPPHSEEASRRREEVIPSARRVAAIDDRILESCDEPVALAEPGDLLTGIPVGRPQVVRQALGHPPQNAIDPLPQSILESAEPLIPDALKLVPSSDPNAGPAETAK